MRVLLLFVVVVPCISIDIGDANSGNQENSIPRRKFSNRVAMNKTIQKVGKEVPTHRTSTHSSITVTNTTKLDDEQHLFKPAKKLVKVYGEANANETNETLMDIDTRIIPIQDVQQRNFKTNLSRNAATTIQQMAILDEHTYRSQLQMTTGEGRGFNATYERGASGYTSGQEQQSSEYETSASTENTQISGSENAEDNESTENSTESSLDMNDEANNTTELQETLAEDTSIWKESESSSETGQSLTTIQLTTEATLFNTTESMVIILSNKSSLSTSFEAKLTTIAALQQAYDAVGETLRMGSMSEVTAESTVNTNETASRSLSTEGSGTQSVNMQNSLKQKSLLRELPISGENKFDESKSINKMPGMNTDGTSKSSSEVEEKNVGEERSKEEEEDEIETSNEEEHEESEIDSSSMIHQEQLNTSIQHQQPSPSTYRPSSIPQTTPQMTDKVESKARSTSTNEQIAETTTMKTIEIFSSTVRTIEKDKLTQKHKAKYISGTSKSLGNEHILQKTKQIVPEVPEIAPEEAVGYVGVPPITHNFATLVKDLPQIGRHRTKEFINMPLLQIQDSMRRKWQPFKMDCSTEHDEKGILCDDWARGGLCNTHRPTMFLFCRRTCLCVGPPEDDDT